MYEIKKVRQNPGEAFRRWFTDDHFDLYVWYDDPSLGHIVGFQLCYDKDQHRRERAMTWHRGRGYHHTRVEDGEADPTANRSAVLKGDGQFPKETIIHSFRQAATALDPDLVSFIVGKLERYTG